MYWYVVSHHPLSLFLASCVAVPPPSPRCRQASRHQARWLVYVTIGQPHSQREREEERLMERTRKVVVTAKKGGGGTDRPTRAGGEKAGEGVLGKFQYSLSHG